MMKLGELFLYVTISTKVHEHLDQYIQTDLRRNINKASATSKGRLITRFEIDKILPFLKGGLVPYQKGNTY